MQPALSSVFASRAARRATALAILLGTLAAAPAHAVMYLCTDERGVTLRLAQKIETSLIAMKCVEEGGSRAHSGGLVPIETRAPAIIAMGRVPVRDAYVRTVTTTRQQTVRTTTRDDGPMPTHSVSQPPRDLDSLIRKVAVEFGHDPHLLKAIVHVESRFNPGAVSPKGAIGLMQVIPATGQRFGLDNPRRQLLQPEQNLRAGAKYLSFLRERFADRLDLVLAAYNAGEGAVDKYRNTIPPYQETRHYVKSVLQAYATYRK
jgi:hypothetical protein